MSNDNVTPIRPGGVDSRPLKRPKVRRKPKAGLHLCESGEFDGFTTLDVVNALHGVCAALDLLCDNPDLNHEEVSTAAKVLAAILQNRVES